MEVYENLANALVLQAVNDYRQALKRLRSRPTDKQGNEVREECEDFFRSAWFNILTDIDPEMLIRRLGTEVK